MKLRDALDQVGQLNDESVIFAERPWALEAEADVGVLDADLRPPASLTSRGLEYFLEVSIAKEVLSVLAARGSTVDERRALLMYYAERDAYPSWVYGF